MGLDLALFPERWPIGGPMLAYVRLPLDRNYDVFALVDHRKVSSRVPLTTTLRPRRMPVPIQDYCDDGIKERTKDPYGDALEFVDAGELAAVPLPDDCGEWTKAAFAFVKALPPSTRIVLWWH